MEGGAGHMGVCRSEVKRQGKEGMGHQQEEREEKVLRGKELGISSESRSLSPRERAREVSDPGLGASS